MKRCKTERSVAKILNDLIHSGTGRIEKFEMIAREGYDAKDCLKMHLECSEDAEDVLARR